MGLVGVVDTSEVPAFGGVAVLCGINTTTSVGSSRTTVVAWCCCLQGPLPWSSAVGTYADPDEFASTPWWETELAVKRLAATLLRSSTTT